MKCPYDTPKNQAAKMWILKKKSGSLSTDNPHSKKAWIRRTIVLKTKYKSKPKQYYNSKSIFSSDEKFQTFLR